MLTGWCCCPGAPHAAAGTPEVAVDMASALPGGGTREPARGGWDSPSPSLSSARSSSWGSGQACRERVSQQTAISDMLRGGNRAEDING